MRRHPTGTALRTKVAQVAPVLRNAAAGMWSAPGLKERYPEYLKAMYGVILKSLARARKRADSHAGG